MSPRVQTGTFCGFTAILPHTSPFGIVGLLLTIQAATHRPAVVGHMLQQRSRAQGTDLPMPFTAVSRFAVSVGRLNHPIDVLNAFDRLARAHDLRAYGAWLLSAEPIEGDRQSYSPGINVFTHFSLPKAYLDEFWKIYQRNGPSPIAREARLNYGPETWTEMSRRLQLTGTDRWFLDLTKKYGMRDGIHFAQGDILIALHSKKLLKLTDLDRAILNSAAQIAAARLRSLLVGKKSKRSKVPVLTPRESEALRWYSLGEEPAEIARRMDVGIKSVNTFLDRARKKLGGKTRAHCILLAIRYRLLTLGASAVLGYVDQLPPM